MKIDKKCQYCDLIFKADNREIKRGYAKFCSKVCSDKGKKTNKKVRIANCKCSFCNKDFFRRPSKSTSKSGLYFCSRECKDKAQRIDGIKDLHLPHYGKGNGKYTYRRLVLENVEKVCTKCGYKEHPEILEVHHKDRNRNNNDIDNLELLCPNCHMWEHYIQKDGRYKNKGVHVPMVGEDALQAT